MLATECASCRPVALGCRTATRRTTSTTAATPNRSDFGAERSARASASANKTERFTFYTCFHRCASIAHRKLNGTATIESNAPRAQEKSDSRRAKHAQTSRPSAVEEFLSLRDARRCTRAQTSIKTFCCGRNFTIRRSICASPRTSKGSENDSKGKRPLFGTSTSDECEQQVVLF